MIWRKIFLFMRVSLAVCLPACLAVAESGTIDHFADGAFVRELDFDTNSEHVETVILPGGAIITWARLGIEGEASIDEQFEDVGVFLNFGQENAPGLEGVRSWAQEFRPGTDWLTGIDILIFRFPDTDYSTRMTVHLREFVQGPDLASGTLEPRDIPLYQGFVDPEWTHFRFGEVPVVAGETLVWVLTREPEAPVFSEGDNYLVGNNQPSQYPDASHAEFLSSVSPPTYEWRRDGNTTTGRDWTFRIRGLGPEDPRMDVGGDGIFEWSWVGPFAEWIELPDFSTSLNEFVRQAQDPGESLIDIPVPIRFTAASGRLRLSDLEIEWIAGPRRIAERFHDLPASCLDRGKTTLKTRFEMRSIRIDSDLAAGRYRRAARKLDKLLWKTPQWIADECEEEKREIADCLANLLDWVEAQKKYGARAGNPE